jgi:outer membrane protein OmpA-like peptidoglycan-associated protein
MVAGTGEIARRCVSAILCSLSLLLSIEAARAEDLSVDEMVCALDPQCAMPFADRRVRGISATAPVSAVRPPGSFDITLNFPFNSADLTADSRAKLDRVAKALTDPSTNKVDVIISGHTDSRGSAEYNLLLSERRAQAVRQFLIAEHGIEPGRLVAKGYGKSRPLFPSDPQNDLNRRVQFQNASYATASDQTAAPSAVAEPPAQAAKPSAQRPKSSVPAARPAARPPSRAADDGL